MIASWKTKLFHVDHKRKDGINQAAHCLNPRLATDLLWSSARQACSPSIHLFIQASPSMFRLNTVPVLHGASSPFPLAGSLVSWTFLQVTDTCTMPIKWQVCDSADEESGDPWLLGNSQETVIYARQRASSARIGWLGVMLRKLVDMMRTD